MLKAEDGATFTAELRETETGWQASYSVISKDLDEVEPGLKVFPTKAEAEAWLKEEAAAHDFILERVTERGPRTV